MTDRDPLPRNFTRTANVIVLVGLVLSIALLLFGTLWLLEFLA